jgi:thiol-disulfide isomerase/thioredoxin
MWIAIGVVVVLGIVAIAVASGSGGGDDDANAAEQFGTPEISGNPLPSYVAGGDDPAVGEIAPTVEGTNFAGQPTSIEPNGKPRMIVFLAHWCPHCNAEAPRLARFLETDGLPDGVDLTIVPTGSNPQGEHWPPSEWLQEMGLQGLPVVLDDQDQSVAAAYGLSAYPFIVTLDADGRVLSRVSGEQPDGYFARTFADLAESATSS